jgi:hypothetical protein
LSEAELLEATANFHSLAMAAMVFYLSIVSGYLIVSHFAGAELARSQVVLVTGLFLAFTSFAMWGSVVYFWMASHFFHQTNAYQLLQTEEIVSPAIIVGIVELLGLVGTLKFMRDIRARSYRRAALQAAEPDVE